MNRFPTTAVVLWLVAVLFGSAASSQDQTSVVEKVRAALAEVLKSDAAKLPVDKPVAELGVDELSVVMWQMASEKEFRVYIADDSLFDPKSKAIRADLSISSMARIVSTSKPWPPGKTE